MDGHPIAIHDATADEIDDLAQMWFDGWQDAHAGILPAELARYRTLESFRERLAAAISCVRSAGPERAPVGFAMTREDELYQLYVSAAARGTGVAAALNEDALARIAADGYRVAWLACAIGNARAARFYEKAGWRRAGTMTAQLETADGTFPLDVWRYEFALAPGLTGC